MAKIKVSELPRKEKSAHNMIRIPAWVFGGLWILGGALSSLNFLIIRIMSEADPYGFEEFSGFFDQILDVAYYAVAFSLFLGVMYLIFGFTYQRFLEKGKSVLLGMAGLTLVGVVLMAFKIHDYSDNFLQFAGEDFGDDEMGFVFNKFVRFISYLGSIIQGVYYLLPAILAYIGFSKLEKIEAAKQAE